MTITRKKTSQKIIKTVLTSFSMLSIGCLMACNSTESLKKEIEEKQQAQEERFNAKIKVLEKQIDTLSTPKNKKKRARQINEAVEREDAQTDVAVDESRTTLSAVNTSTVKLEDFNVNLRDPSGAKKLQMTISLEVNPVVAETLKNPEIMDSIRDTIIMFVSEFTVENLDGLDGKMGLRDGIKLRINTVLSPQKIEQAYFTKFIY